MLFQARGTLTVLNQQSAISNQQSRETVVGTSASITVSRVRVAHFTLVSTSLNLAVAAYVALCIWT